VRPQQSREDHGGDGPDPQADRSRTDRKLAGVCGGLAQYVNTDATLIRVLFVVLALLGGPGLVIYLLMWILVPEEPQGTA
jgi:phage shock protein C